MSRRSSRSNMALAGALLAGALLAAPPASAAEDGHAASGPLGHVTVFRNGLPKIASPTGLALGPHGILAFADEHGVVGTLNASGKFHVMRVGSGQQPTSVTFDRRGNLWYTDPAGGHVGKISPRGVVSVRQPVLFRGLLPAGILSDAAGDVWVSMQQRVCRIRPNGKLACYDVPVEGHDGAPLLSSMTRGSDGNIWFIATSDEDALAICRITPAGQLTLFRTDVMPNAIAATTTSGLWLSDRDGIAQISTDGVVTRLIAAAALPHGPPSVLAASNTRTAYYIDYNENRVGRISSDGTIVTQTLGPQSHPRALLVAPDGSVWIGEQHGIAHLVPHG